MRGDSLIGKTLVSKTKVLRSWLSPHAKFIIKFVGVRRSWRDGLVSKTSELTPEQVRILSLPPIYTVMVIWESY